MAKPQLRCQCPVPLQNKEQQQEKCQVVHVNEAATVAPLNHLPLLEAQVLFPVAREERPLVSECAICTGFARASALTSAYRELQMKSRIETRARRKK